MNRRVAALRARTAAIYRTKEVPHTLPIFSRSRVIVDHPMSLCQTGRSVACAQCASRTEAPSNGLRKYHRRERHDGTTARRHDGTTARRHDGTTARRHDGTTARRHDGTTARRHDGTTARRHDPQSRGLLKFKNIFLLYLHACVILTGYLVSDISFSTFHLLFNVDLMITDMYES